jgi:aldose 1-epimerase
MKPAENQMPIQIDESTRTPDGSRTHRITLRVGGIEAVLTDLGARLLELRLPDRDGRSADVVLGNPDVGSNTTSAGYFGATCGRYANRIRRGSFVLDGRPVSVTTNEGANHLHGGDRGFDRKLWDWESDDTRNAVRFALLSPDGEEGFPGHLTATAEYVLGDSTLDITMTAQTTARTVVNLVNHAYWNLAGHDSGDVLEHYLEIESDFVTPVDDELIPTGEIRSVIGTPFDFRASHAIVDSIRDVKQSGAGRPTPGGFAGYDHNWVIRGQIGSMRPCVSLLDPESGRRLDLSTNEAGVQIYTGGYLDGVPGKAGATYRPFQGLTLETQRFPDSPNHGHFPSSILRPGELYDHRMRFEFSID